jgi:hypothetical protein
VQRQGNRQQTQTSPSRAGLIKVFPRMVLCMVSRTEMVLYKREYRYVSRHRHTLGTYHMVHHRYYVGTMRTQLYNCPFLVHMYWESVWRESDS